MSRFTAGLGGGLGAIGGAIAGSYAGAALRGKMTRSDAEEAGIALGAVLGATIGAAVFAGGDAPKQIGTSGVGFLGEWGLGSSFALAGPSFVAGNTWQLEFESDKPVSPQQFFAFVSSYQAELGAYFDTVSFMPIDQTHFSAIIKWRADGTLQRLGDSEVIDGVRFTLTDAKPYFEPAPPHAPLSTGEIVGISAAGATVLGGIVYVATRKKPRRRRRS